MERGGALLMSKIAKKKIFLGGPIPREGAEFKAGVEVTLGGLMGMGKPGARFFDSCYYWGAVLFFPYCAPFFSLGHISFYLKL